LIPRDAAESKFSAVLATSQGQVEAALSGLSNLREEMQKELADLRKVSQVNGEATEAFQSEVLRNIETKTEASVLQLNNRLKDIESKSDATAAQLNDRLDGLVSQFLENTTRLDGLTPRVDAAESQFSSELATSQGQVEASLSGLSRLREEMQKEIADLRMALQEHREATEAFQSAVLRDIQPKSDAIALQLSNRLKDIESKSDATALQLKDALDGLVSQFLEHTTRLDGLTPRVEAAESQVSSELATTQGH
jgi:hypothetical protein